MIEKLHEAIKNKSHFWRILTNVKEYSYFDTKWK